MLNRATLRFSTNFLVLVVVASVLIAGFFIYIERAQAQAAPKVSAPVGGDPPELGTPPGTTSGLEPGGEQAPPTAQGEAPPGATPGAKPGADQAAQAAALNAANAELAKIVIESEKPPEISQDETVSHEDLGSSKKPLILPDNPLYVFKGWGRGLQKALTFDPVKKAELELKHANAKFVECETLVEKRGDDVKPEILEKVLASAEKDLDSIAAKKEQIKERKTDNKELVDSFTDKLADSGLKHQKFLTTLEIKLPETVKERVTEAVFSVREKSLKNQAEVLSSVETAKELSETLTTALENQPGSKFKNFKNLEVLSALEDRLPEEALKGVEIAKENAFKQLHDNLTQLPETEQKEKFSKYVEFLPGNAGEHLELVDEFKSALGSEEVAPEFISQLNIVKEKAFKKFEDQARQFTDPAARAELFRPFKQGKLEDLRIVSQLKDKLGTDIPEDLKKEVEAVHTESFSKFKQKFADDPKALETATQAEGIFKKFSENPDAVDFKVLEDLRNSLNPEQKKFVMDMEESVGQKFAEKFAQQGDKFGKFFADPTDPHSLGILEGLKDRLPEQARKGIETAIEFQRQGFRDHIQDLDDPFILGKIQSVVGADADLKKSFEQGDTGFFQKLDSRRQEFETKFREEAQQRFEKFQGLQQGLLGPPVEVGGQGGLPAGLDLPPEALEKFRDLQQKFQSGGFGKFEPPGGFGAPGGVQGGPSHGVPGATGGQFPGGGTTGGQFPGGGVTGGQFPGGGEQPQLGAPLGGFPGGGTTGGQFPGGFGAGGFKAEDFLNIGKFIGAPPPTTFFRHEAGGAKTGEGKEEGGLPGGFPGTGGEFPGAGGFPGTGGAPSEFQLPSSGELPGTTGGEFPGGPSSLGTPSFGAPGRQPTKGSGGESGGPFFTPSLKTESGPSLGAPRGGASSEGGTSPFGEFPSGGGFPGLPSKQGEHQEPFFAPKSEGGLGAPSFPGSLPSGGTQPGGGLPGGGQGTQGGPPTFGTPSGGQQPSGGFQHQGGLPSGGDFKPPFGDSGAGGLPSGLPPVGGGGSTGGLLPSGGTSGGGSSIPSGGGTFSPPPSGDSGGGGGTFSPPPSGGGGGAPPPSGGEAPH